MKNNWITIGACLLMMVLAMIFGVQGKPTEMGLIILAGSLSIAFLNIHHIQRFKGAGFEAEMRQVVQEAHATVEQLRILAASSAESTLTTLMAGNFFDGTTLDARLELHDRLIQSLSEIGFSKSQIDIVDRKWRAGVGVIYHRGIRNCLEGRSHSNIINISAGQEICEASSQFQDLLHFESWSAPSSNEMREFIDERGLITPALSELLDDYSYFEETACIKRREVFITL